MFFHGMRSAEREERRMGRPVVEGKREYRVIKSVVLCAVLFVASVAWGSHPLVTDDAET